MDDLVRSIGKGGKPCNKLFERDLSFESGELRTKTEMPPKPESEMTVEGPGNIKALRISA